MLHSSGKSWWAVGVSAVQLLVASAAILIAVAIGLPAAWIPLSALALANGLSLSAISIVLLRSRFRSQGYRVGSLVEQGFPLLWSSLPSPLAGFVGTWLVGLLAGAEALGYAEAARIVAQPVLVLTLGLAATYEPRSMEFALGRRRLEARHVSRQFSRAVLLVAGVFVIWFGLDWRLNPFSLMTPTAYAIPGLVALSVVANASYSLYFPYRAELIAMRRTRRLFWIEAGGSIFHVAAASSAAWIGSFAQPTSFFCSGAFRSGFARAEAERGYQDAETVDRANGGIQ
jgi:O-antigen/teichoic acid export membrane protein